MSPTIPTLMRVLRCSEEQARLIRLASKLKRSDFNNSDIAEFFPKTYAWQRKCYNELGGLRLAAVAEIMTGAIDTYAIWHSGDSFYSAPRFSYVPSDDMYDMTLCEKNGSFYLSSVGDYLERHPNATNQPG